MSRNRRRSPNRQSRCSEFTDKFVQIMEDSKKRDEDMFSSRIFLILYQLQINEMHQS